MSDPNPFKKVEGDYDPEGEPTQEQIKSLVSLVDQLTEGGDEIIDNKPWPGGYTIGTPVVREKVHDIIFTARAHEMLIISKALRETKKVSSEAAEIAKIVFLNEPGTDKQGMRLFRIYQEREGKKELSVKVLERGMRDPASVDQNAAEQIKVAEEIEKKYGKIPFFSEIVRNIGTKFTQEKWQGLMQFLATFREKK